MKQGLENVHNSCLFLDKVSDFKKFLRLSIEEFGVYLTKGSVDWSGRCSTPAGVRGREAPRHARGKRASGAEINNQN